VETRIRGCAWSRQGSERVCVGVCLEEHSARHGGTVSTSTLPLLGGGLGGGLVAGDAEAEAGPEAGGDAARIADREALLSKEAVVSVSGTALGGRIYLIVPRVRVQSDASPEQSERKTDNQPAILGIDRIVHVPTELGRTG